MSPHDPNRPPVTRPDPPPADPLHRGPLRSRALHRRPLELARRAAVGVHASWWSPPLVGGQRGQGTVEYALVLIGAAAVALALVAWVARSGAIGRLFDAVIGRVLSSAG